MNNNILKLKKRAFRIQKRHGDKLINVFRLALLIGVSTLWVIGSLLAWELILILISGIYFVEKIIKKNK